MNGCLVCGHNEKDCLCGPEGLSIEDCLNIKITRRRCPECKSENISTERRLNGDSECLDCNHKGASIDFLEPEKKDFSYEELVDIVKDIPMAYYPGLLKEFMTAAIDKGVFRNGKAHVFIKDLEEKLIAARSMKDDRCTCAGFYKNPNCKVHGN